MPVIVVAVVAFAGFVLYRRSLAVQNLPPPPPKLPAKVPKTRADAVPVNFTQGIALAADKLAGAAFMVPAAQSIAKYGLAVAIGVGVVNVAAGVIVAIGVLMIANIVNMVGQLAQGDNHEEGLAEYTNNWHDVKRKFEDEITSDAAVKNQTPDAHELDIASTAYADGFMQWTNYLIALRAWQGSLYGPGISGDVQWTTSMNGSGMNAVNFAWKQGKLVSVAPPALSPITDPAASGGLKYWRRLSTVPGFLTVLPPEWQRVQSMLAGPNGLINATDADIYRLWYRVGMVHANTAGFMQSLGATVGLGQNLWQHVENSRINGFFVGTVLVPPGVPSNIGMEADGFVAYSPDNSNAQYVRTP